MKITWKQWAKPKEAQLFCMCTNEEGVVLMMAEWRGTSWKDLQLPALTGARAGFNEMEEIALWADFPEPNLALLTAV